MIRRRSEWYVVVGLLLVCGLAACTSSDSPQATDTSLPVSPTPLPPTVTAPSPSSPTSPPPTATELPPTASPTPVQPTPPPPPTGTPTAAASAPPTPALASLQELGFRLVAPVEQSDFVHLYSTSDDQLYVTFNRSAVYRLEGDDWVLVVDDPPADIVGIDDVGRVWTATPDEVAAWDGDAWRAYDADDGWLLAVGMHWQLASDFMSASDGTVWIATGQDVRTFDGQRWRVYTYADMTLEPVSIDDTTRSAFSLAEADGAIWVGECTNSPLGPVGGVGARWFVDGAWHGADSPVATGCVTEIALAPDGAVWLDAGPKLYRYDPQAGDWGAYPLPSPPDDFARFGYVTDMPFDAKGDPWLELSTCGPAHCYTTFPRYHLERALGSFQRVTAEMEFVNSWLCFDAAEQGWRFAEDGVHRLKGDHFERVNDARLVGFSPVRQTSDGAIWVLYTVGENRGLWRFPTNPDSVEGGLR